MKLTTRKNNPLTHSGAIEYLREKSKVSLEDMIGTKKYFLQRIFTDEELKKGGYTLDDFKKFFISKYHKNIPYPKVPEESVFGTVNGYRSKINKYN